MAVPPFPHPMSITPIQSALPAFLTLLLALAPAAHAAAVPAVTMTVNGAPAKVGDYAPGDLPNLVLDNGNLKITFGKDTRDDFSATSVIFKGQELAHNLHGVVPRDTDGTRTFYHDYNASGGYLHAQVVRIIKNTPELVHFAIIDNGGGNRPYLEDHYVMLKGENGIHPYVIIKGSQGAGEMRTMYRFDMSILDWAYSGERLSQQLSYAYLQAISTVGNAGDETWRLPDGSVLPDGSIAPHGMIYSKYDYCLYYSEQPFWGHLGHGYGAFFMPVSTESYAGGPLRQELDIHQDALILNYLGGGHFGGGGTAGGLNGQEKIHGPWFVYFATGANNEAIIADAKKAAAAEKAKWPYQWMDEPVYPTKRTTVTGQLTISHNRSAAYAYIILGQPGNANGGRGAGGRGGRRGGAGAPAGSAASGAASAADFADPANFVFGQAAPAADAAAPEASAAAPAASGGRRGGRGGRRGAGAAGPANTDPNALVAGATPNNRGGGGANEGAVPDRASVLYTQAGDYIFYVKADADGKFTLPNVRPGTYTLYAWQTQGPITQSFAKDGVVVSGDKLDLGKIDWDAPYHPNLLWQVGQADRLAGEYKFGSSPRSYQWMLQVPADLTFTIGKSKEATDWYYAQKTGTWTVAFNTTKAYSGNGYLTVAVAGGSGSVTAALNGTDIGRLSYPRDASVDRSTNRSGVYHRNEYTFPASLLKSGDNTLTLTCNGGGLMYDTIVMESD